MKKQDNFQTQLQNPKWCEKQVRRFLSKGSKKFSIFFLCESLLLHISVTLSAYYGKAVNPDAVTSGCSPWDIAVYAVMFTADFMFLFLFFSPFFLKYGKRWKRIGMWGNSQEIYSLICTEFLDKKHPPKKSLQLWTTPHFILLTPNIYSKLYYLPLLTKRLWTPKEGDVIYFSDGSKISLTGISTASRLMIEEAVAGYLSQNSATPDKQKNPLSNTDP